MRRHFGILVSLAALLAGCSAPAVPEQDVTTAATPQRSADVITQAELADPALGDADALSVIKRLRPQFLATRGTTSANTAGAQTHVTINGGPFLPTSALTSIRASEILDIRYLSASAAAQQYGSMAAASPVIVIRRK